MALITVSEIRNRLPYNFPPDYVIDEFIAQAQNFVEAYAGRTFISSDNYYNLAKSICIEKSLIAMLQRRLWEAPDERAEISRELAELKDSLTQELKSMRRTA